MDKAYSIKDFLKVRKIGQGAYGTCYLAFEKKTGSNWPVVLKSIKKGSGREESIEREFRIQSSIKYVNFIYLFICKLLLIL
jgi:hypothetical protein